VPRLELSSPWDLRLPLRWIAILHPVLQAQAGLTATGGVETGADVAEALLVGPTWR
jgi:dihydroorotate dehydrogenase (fumarate)